MLPISSLFQSIFTIAYFYMSWWLMVKIPKVLFLKFWSWIFLWNTRVILARVILCICWVPLVVEGYLFRYLFIYEENIFNLTPDFNSEMSIKIKCTRFINVGMILKRIKTYHWFHCKTINLSKWHDPLKAFPYFKSLLMGCSWTFSCVKR